MDNRQLAEERTIRTKRAGRVSAACQRCRKQKLKCDQDRPCSLCIRSDAPCISEPRPSKSQTYSVSGNKRRSSRDSGSLERGELRDARTEQPHEVIAMPSSNAKSREENAELYQEGSRYSQNYAPPTSSVGISQEMINQPNPKYVLGRPTPALPESRKTPTSPRNQSDDMMLICDILNFNLPPKPVTDFLLETYIDAVHWFMTILHERTFRLRYEQMAASQKWYKRASKQVILMLTVLSLGAQYTTQDRVRTRCSTFDLENFRHLSLTKVEGRILYFLNDPDIESVQICLLLASFYLYHGRPNLAFVILGAGIRCSQIISLHRESLWHGISEIEKEERRRVFWALYNFDRFASIVYGKPCSIPELDVDVKQPALQDSVIQRPGFHATIPDSLREPVTTFTYIKFKIRLYQIATPIVQDVYFHRDNIASTISKVRQIDQELTTWFSNIPPELRLRDLTATNIGTLSPKNRLFILQALSLQLAYDNIQILLHRPLLTQDLRNVTPIRDEFDVSIPYVFPGSSNEAFDRDAISPEDLQKFIFTSKERCWDSAIRSSNLGKYKNYLQNARETHVAAFLGINLYTASMTLCIFALSNPISSQAQVVKQALSRILALSRFLSDRALLSAQTNQVLRNLMRLILEREMKAMLSTRIPNSPDDTCLNDTGSLSAPSPTQENTQPTSSSNNDPYISPSSLNMPDADNVDINDDISSLQRAIFPEYTSEAQSSETLINQSQCSWNMDLESLDGSGSLFHEDGDPLAGLEMNLGSIGQTWLWGS